jgi:oligopeptide transport system permease protein
MTDVTADAVPETELVKGTSLWRDAYKRLKKNKMAMAGGIVFITMVVACFLGPFLITWTWGYDFESQDLVYGAQPPSWQHWFGTDYFGRDNLTRTLYGGQISLIVGFLAASVSAVVGIVYGAVAGYFGGRIDAVMMRIVDILYALPYMFIVIILVTILGQSLELIFVALGLFGWLLTARIVRGQVLSLKEREFVQAARSIGVRAPAIIFRHIVPNTLGPIIVYFTLTVPAVILEEAFLSFLGLGVQEPRPSLGLLIKDGADQMIIFWWQLVFPGLVMSVLLFSLNFFGDGLRDALDPRMK